MKGVGKDRAAEDRKGEADTGWKKGKETQAESRIRSWLIEKESGFPRSSLKSWGNSNRAGGSLQSLCRKPNTATERMGAEEKKKGGQRMKVLSFPSRLAVVLLSVFRETQSIAIHSQPDGHSCYPPNTHTHTQKQICASTHEPSPVNKKVHIETDTFSFMLKGNHTT